MIAVDDLLRVAPDLNDEKLSGKLPGIVDEANRTTAAALAGVLDFGLMQAYPSTGRDSLDLLALYKAREFAYQALYGTQSDQAVYWRTQYDAMVSALRSGHVRLSDSQQAPTRGKVAYR